MRVFLAFLLMISQPISSAHASGAIGAATSAAMMGGMVATMNSTAGKGFLSKCSGTAVWFCIAAGLSFAQVPLSLMSGKSGANAAKSLLSQNGVSDWDTTDLGGGTTGAQLDSKFQQAESAYNQAKKDLAAKGIDVDAGTIKTPKGSKPLSSVSGASLAADGLISPEQIAEADQVLNAVKSKLQQIAMNASPGGGGGSSGGSKIKFDYQSPDYSSLFGEKEKPNAPKTAGLVKTINGQPYGASVNNLFDMIRNRYEIKTRENFFVEK